jgi:histidine triad (HIT) family protein
MPESCLFCRIVGREIPADLLYEDDHVLAFRDIAPQAPIHVLVVPKEHIPTANDLRETHRELLATLMLAAPKIARDQGLDEDGYRLVLNCQEGAGQSVFHLHLHILGGRPMNWPPG